jgi:hypothetical protein
VSQPKTDDEDEFLQMLERMSTRLDQRTDAIQDVQSIVKEVEASEKPLDPLIMQAQVAVKSCLADYKAGRFDPRKSELWAQGLVN